MKTAAVLTALTLVAAAFPAAAQDFSFRDHRIGDRIEQHKGAYRSPHDSLPESVFDPCKPDKNTPGLVGCFDWSLEPLGTRRGNRRDFHGLEAEYLHYSYLDGRLVGFNLSIIWRDYAALKQMVAGRYGKPAKTETAKFRTRAGVEYDGEVLTWKTPHGPMFLMERAGSVTTSSLSLTSEAAEAQIKARAGASNAEKGRKAF